MPWQCTVNNCFLAMISCTLSSVGGIKKKKNSLASSHLSTIRSSTRHSVSHLVSTCFGKRDPSSIVAKSEGFLKSSPLHGERLNHAPKSYANPSPFWHKATMPLWKAFCTTWIVQFINGNKPLYPISFNLISNNCHILRLILGS